MGRFLRYLVEAYLKAFPPTEREDETDHTPPPGRWR